MEKKRILILVAVVCLLLLAGGGLVLANGGDEDFGGEKEKAASYARCFTATGTTATIMLNYDGQWIEGIAQSSTCGTGAVLGDMGPSKWAIYRDWPSGYGCVEGVWYTVNPDFSYEWTNTYGSGGTGLLTEVPCP